MAKTLDDLMKQKAELEKSIRSAKASMAGELRIADAHVKKAIGGAVFALSKDPALSPDVRSVLSLVVDHASGGVKSTAGKVIHEKLRSSLM